MLQKGVSWFETRPLQGPIATGGDSKHPLPVMFVVSPTSPDSAKASRPCRMTSSLGYGRIAPGMEAGFCWYAARCSPVSAAVPKRIWRGGADVYGASMRAYDRMVDGLSWAACARQQLSAYLSGYVRFSQFCKQTRLAPPFQFSRGPSCLLLPTCPAASGPRLAQ